MFGFQPSFSQDAFTPQHTQPSGLLQKTNAKAVLYVTRPYRNQFQDVALRPFNYRFDENFIGHATDVASMAQRGVASSNRLISDVMSRTNLSDHMLPSPQAALGFSASQLNDNWQFVLVLTETGVGLIGGNTQFALNGSNQTRRIYTGYFIDEPLNAFMMGSGKATLNPNSVMVITHKTIVGQSNDFGGFSSAPSLSTYTSENVFHPTISKALTSPLANSPSVYHNDLYLMTPQSCLSTVDVTPDGYATAIPGAAHGLTAGNAAEVVNDILEQPAHNVGHLLKGVIKNKEEHILRKGMGMYRNDSVFDDTFLDEGFARNAFASNLGIAQYRGSSIFDLDVNSRISAADLDMKVNGDLDVLPINVSGSEFYDTADQHAVSMTNQFSFLIATVVPPILLAAGVSDFAFEFSIARRNGQLLDEFIPYSISTCYDTTPDKKKLLASAVAIELKKGILSTIYNTCSDYHVVVKANTIGTTEVRLTLVAQGYAPPAPFVIPTCLGGLVSPLIGDAASNSHNSSELEGLLAHTSNIGSSSESTMMTQDDQLFSDMASGVFDGLRLPPNVFMD